MLEVGTGQGRYRSRVPHHKWTTLDINPGSGADMIADIHNVPWESECFDTVIATEVLEHCYSPEKAVREIHRLLRKGGATILSTRFIHPHHPAPCDYFRFSAEGLKYLFRDYEQVEILHHGNLFQSVLTLLDQCRCLRAILRPLSYLAARVESEKTNCPCGFLVFARK